MRNIIKDIVQYEAPAVGFRLADATTLGDGTVILSYHTYKALEAAA